MFLTVYHHDMIEQMTQVRKLCEQLKYEETDKNIQNDFQAH